MKRKHNYKITNRYTISGLAILVVTAAVVTAFIVKPGSTDTAATNKKQPVGAAVPSQFTFTGVPGWWQGATNKTSVAIFPNSGKCFVSVQHITGSIAAKQAKSKQADDSLLNSGHTITLVTTKAMTIKTNTGIKQYQLAQSSITNPAGASADDGSQVEGGQESAYIPLSANDFLYVSGYCNTTDELSTTLPVLQAITFDANKAQ